jgi:RNA recognition motif-containing protein
MARLFVGNLSFDAGEHDLYALFAPYGHVRSAHLSCDLSGRSNGYGFVVMPDHTEARKAAEVLHGRPVRGLPLTVQIMAVP